MFDDHQTDQTHNNMNAGVPDVSAPASPTMGVGMNPNPTYIPPSSASAPTIVLPTQSPPSSAPSDASDTATSTPVVPAHGASGDLEDIKRGALAQLSPLVNKLEQTPEEKYKTIMMMIQASDNQDLISEAYENAQKITDEKVKAEALLNIVNEINYFAQKSQG